MLMIISAKIQAQKWQPGHFTDVKGNKETGLIRLDPSAKGPIKDEGFIEFKENNKANPFKLSASDLQSFVMGKDSFVVAHAPNNENWGKNETDFVRVAIDEDIKLFVTYGGKGSGGGSGFSFSPGIGAGIGTGGYGSGFGGGVSGGVSVPIGGHGGSGYGGKTTYYYGENQAGMKRLTNQNFEDVMIDIMGDEPDVVEKIHTKVYVLANIDKLIAYFKQVQASHQKQ